MPDDQRQAKRQTNLGRRRRLGKGLLPAVLFLGASGCFTCPTTVCPPNADVIEAVQAAPKESRNRLHVVMIDGCWPADWSGMQDLRGWLFQAGFLKTWYGDCFSGATMHKEILRVHAEDPLTRFAVIGFDQGAGVAVDLAEKAALAGLPVDLVLTIEPRPATREMIAAGSPIGRKVVICGANGEREPIFLPDCREVFVPATALYRMPSQACVRTALVEELRDAALRIPRVCRPAKKECPLIEPRPLPRPVQAPTRVADEWDFLRSVDEFVPTLPPTVGEPKLPEPPPEALPPPHNLPGKE